MCFGGNSSPAPAPAQAVKPTYVHNPYLDSFGDPAAGSKDNPNVTNRASLEIPIGFTGRGGKGEAGGSIGPDGNGLGIMKKALSSDLAIRPTPGDQTVLTPGSNNSPFAPDDYSSASGIWTNIRRANKFSDINWSDPSLNGAKLSDGASSYLSDNWTNVRRAAQFGDINFNDPSLKGNVAGTSWTPTPTAAPPGSVNRTTAPPVGPQLSIPTDPRAAAVSRRYQ